ISGNASFTLRTIDGTLPVGAGTVTIRFRAQSDNGYSDEDGAYLSTCGLAAIDDIVLSGAIVHSANFESGTNGWVSVTPVSPASQEYADLEDIANLSLPTTFPCNTCGVRDSVLIFVDPSGQHPAGQSNVAISPWIDLKAGGDVGRSELFVTFNAYSGTNTPVSPNLAYGVQYYPWVCPVTGLIGTSPIIYNNAFFFFGNPTCGQVTYSSLRSYAPLAAEQIRVVLGPHGYLDPNTSNGPWFDNIRVGTRGPNTAPPIVLNYRFQDNFAADGSLNPLSTSRLDSSLSGPDYSRDTLAVTTTGSNAETRVVFRVTPGQFLPQPVLVSRSARWTPEPTLGPGWYSARLDTAQQGTNPPYVYYNNVVEWMTTFHEADPGFQGTDTSLDPTDPGHLLNDIFPDDLLTPGSRLDYFFAARFRPPDPRNPSGTSWYVTPDTTGGNWFEMEVLPSSMAADTTWNCVLIVDGHDYESRADHDLEESALTLALGSDGPHARPRFDRWDINSASNMRLGRPAGSAVGATLVQLSAYRRVLWYAGYSSSVRAPGADDVAILEPWLKAAGAGSRGFWLNGATSAGSMNSGTPKTFLNSTLGVTHTCGAIRAAACPSGSLADLSFCLPLTAAPAPAFPPTGSASLAQNGCPDGLNYGLLAVNGAVPTATANLRYLKNGTPTDAASVTVNAPSGFVYRSVVDAFPVSKLRRTPGNPNDPAQCANVTPVYERTLDVLAWLGMPDCPAASVTGVGPVPEGVSR
ncbi:MAG TPA: hypothetical protein VF720_01980, partial [Candidatus Eisenbacteria bacterium]